MTLLIPILLSLPNATEAVGILPKFCKKALFAMVIQLAETKDFYAVRKLSFKTKTFKASVITSVT